MSIQSQTSSDARTATSKISKPAKSNKAVDDSTKPDKKPSTGKARHPQSSSKPASKHDKLMRLLSRVKGCGIDQLVEGLDWQPHTIRAAISRLRKGGLEVETSKSRQGKTTYRIISGGDESVADK